MLARTRIRCRWLRLLLYPDDHSESESPSTADWPPSATSPRVHPPRPWKSAHTLNVGVDSDFTFSQTSFTSFTSSPFRLSSPPRGKSWVESEASSTCSSPRFGILENDTQKKGPALWPQDVERGPA
ncbi:hypothetical protein JG688_00010471 [Phytophthora aleatoria]|uniref:Uncharacterized protein n=1 Tax=Phytophthora aleatoria TaxID=2496075 RepID=A0A8J5IM08_9STRA|nr:hypothetical protein JG688_00010471 [Phytophthora aleatoria]